MKNLIHVVALIGVLLAELFVSVKLTLVPGNLAKEPYRREQRVTAMRAYAEDRSLEREAAMRQEMRVASHHVLRRQLVGTALLFGAFLTVDATVILKRKHDAARQTVA
jgi:hypothetical protein